MNNQKRIISEAVHNKDPLLKSLWNKARENIEKWKPINKLVNQIKDRLIKLTK